MRNSIKKLIILTLFAIISICSMFTYAETYEELEKTYVTREEFGAWATVFSDNFSGLKLATENKLYNEIRFQMWARDIKDDTDPVVYVKQLEQYKMKQQAAETGQLSNVFSITFVMNGGSWKMGKQPLMFRKGNTETQLPDVQDIYRSDKVFVGWYDNINLDGGVVTSIPAATYKPTIYFAKWRDFESGESPEDYSGKIKLTYYTDGGAWTSGTPTTYYKQDTGMTLPSGSQISKQGYSFEGWYKTSALSPSDKFETIPAYIDPPIKEAYAKWEEATYNVTYNLGGANWNSFAPTTSRKYSESITLPTSDKLTYADHIFIGWYENASFTGSAVTSIPTYTAYDKTLYAKWVNTTYSLTLIENGGSYVGITEPTSRPYSSSFTLPTATQIKKTGYSFGGWYTSSSFSGSAVTSIPAYTEGDKRYYAKWIENSYPVHYNISNGYTYASLPSQKKYTETVALPNFDQMSINSGYKFRGWFSDSGLTQLISEVPSYTEEITVYAGIVPMTDWSYLNTNDEYLNWMSKIPDDMYLSEINIPGAHDAGCFKVKSASSLSWIVSKFESFAITQAHYVAGYTTDPGQLAMGVRAFDIRLDNDGYLCHGPDNETPSKKFWALRENGEKLRFQRVVEKMNSFLISHPTETVILCITYESGSGDRTTVRNKVLSELSGYESRIYTSTSIPKLGDVRGRICIIDDGLSLADNNPDADFTKYFKSKSLRNKTYDGVYFYYENSYDVNADTKVTKLRAKLDSCSQRRINTQINKASKTGYSGNIWHNSNDYTSLQTPNYIDTVVNDFRESYDWVQGATYGINWMDFVRQPDAKIIIGTNP